MTTGEFLRDALPDWQAYADREGLTLVGRGKWRNVLTGTTMATRACASTPRAAAGSA